MAVIARKQKRFADEVSILERYVQQPSSGSKQGQELYQRLVKAYELTGNPKGDTDPLFIRKALLVDTETTGLSSEDEVIEVGMVLFRYSHLSGRILDIEAEYTGLRQPSFPIPPAATAKHGITNKDVRGKSLDEGQIKHLLAAANILISHNAAYERRMLFKLFPEVGNSLWYCSMNGIDWAAHGCASKKLETLLSHYDVSITQKHRAADDVQMTLALLSRTNPKTGQPFFLELIRAQPNGFVSVYNAKQDKPHQPLQEQVIGTITINISEIKPVKGFWGWLTHFLGR